jgi:hypothetical protein
VFGVDDRAGYMAKLGPVVQERLAADEMICEGVNYGF